MSLETRSGRTVAAGSPEAMTAAARLLKLNDPTVGFILWQETPLPLILRDPHD